LYFQVSLGIFLAFYCSKQKAIIYRLRFQPDIIKFILIKQKTCKGSALKKHALKAFNKGLPLSPKNISLMSKLIQILQIKVTTTKLYILYRKSFVRKGFWFENNNKKLFPATVKTSKNHKRDHRGILEHDTNDINYKRVHFRHVLSRLDAMNGW